MAKKRSFDVTVKDYANIMRILKRAKKLGLYDKDEKFFRELDIRATIANGQPLDFKKWLAFDDHSFKHDFYGISDHINHRTGKLNNFFLPRCSK